MPSSRRPLVWTNRVANPVLAPLLRAPLVGPRLGRHLAVVEYTGHRSGRPRRLVTQYERDGGTVTIRVGMPERKTWWRNFRTPHPVRVRLAGRVLHGRAHTATGEGGDVRVVVALEEAGPGSRSEPGESPA